MEKFFNPFDKECMRMAMLKHEETFREQVYELHRLYQIQKLLMKNIPSSKKHGQDSDRRSFKIAPELIQTKDDQDMQEISRRYLDLELPVDQTHAPVTEGNNRVQIDDETELELTLGLGPTSRSTRKKALDASIYSDSAATFSSSSSGSSHYKRTDSATLLMGKTNREELMGWQQWGLDHLHSSGPGGARKNGSSIEDQQFRQDRHSNPPWLFQALSLNTS